MPAIFPSREQLRDIAGPIAADANRQLGSTVRILRPVLERQADGSYKRKPAAAAEGVPMRLKVLTAEESQETFGVNTVVRARGVVSDDVDIRLGDVIEVASGHMAGERFKVDARVPKDMSASIIVGLADTRMEEVEEEVEEEPE